MSPAVDDHHFVCSTPITHVYPKPSIVSAHLTGMLVVGPRPLALPRPLIDFDCCARQRAS
eukprot:7738941-Pyramimonas_sp.AAC.1